MFCITASAYSDTSSDAEATLFKDYSASHKKLLLAKDLMEDDVNGYRLLDMSLLGQFVNTVSCPHCNRLRNILCNDEFTSSGSPKVIYWPRRCHL